VIVLWIMLLITITTSAFTLMARMDSLEAHTILWSTKARLAAEAGMNIAVLSLRDPEEESRLIPDGRPFLMQYRDAQVEVMVTDERGKLNINKANDLQLLQLFLANGLEDEQAELLTAAIQDWVDIDELTRPNGAELPEYESAGYQVGPGNRSFIMVEELLQVIGMPWELFQAIQPGLTVWTDSGSPNPSFAPAEALMALPEMTQELAEEFVQERHGLESLADMELSLPGGQVAMAQGGGLTYSIVAKATMPNGIWDQIEATVRLGTSENGQPFRIVHWREGFHH
jgi:general secretion pathway protein K